MNKKFIISGAVIFLIFVIGLIWLAKQDTQETASGNDALQTTFEQYALELELDVPQFIADYNGTAVADYIEEDMNDADQLNINATPTLLIDGQKLQYSTIDDIKQALDEKIAQNVTQEITNPEHTKGAENPKVIVVEFSDFQCPACAGFTPFINQVLSEYPENAALEYRHFPLPKHPSADEASRAAEAAAVQGKFWEMHDLLFERQSDWS